MVKKGKSVRNVKQHLSLKQLPGEPAPGAQIAKNRRESMKVIGLTGGIASGKSTITNYIESKGIPVIDGDRVSREVVLPGSEALMKIEEEFGKEYILSDGTLDRKKMGNHVFNNPAERKKLEGILHPIIRNEFIKKINEYKKNPEIKIVLLDAALLIESKMTDLTDSLWLVYADKEVQIKRVMARDNVSEDVALSIINSQMLLSDKKKYADEIIDNNKSFLEVYEKVDNLLKKYS
ncbi:MAG: dephospho-CoA kinase [Clostridia bacterium]|nr:dephospho-CoA kinase [Clostridia bacterium]